MRNPFRIMDHPALVAGWMVALVFCAHARAAEVSAPASAPGYILEIPDEPEAARLERHRLVAQRRAGVVVMVHRGASRFAPENTLEAFAAAMDHGADGCEIDLRRTTDGVFYFHHDDVLGRIVQGEGRINRLTYFELLSRPLTRVYGEANARTRVPTLAAFLVLARQRAMLLHLDVKEPGLEEDLIKAFDAADVWDHIVHVTPSPYSDKLRFHPKVKLLEYKGWFNEAGKTEEQRQAFMAKPQTMIFVKDDPREVVEFLKRPAGEKLPLPEGLRVRWNADGPAKQP